MNALRVLASPKIWISIVGGVLALALIFYAYLAAVASPEENLKDHKTAGDPSATSWANLFPTIPFPTRIRATASSSRRSSVSYSRGPGTNSQ